MNFNDRTYRFRGGENKRQMHYVKPELLVVEAASTALKSGGTDKDSTLLDNLETSSAAYEADE